MILFPQKSFQGLGIGYSREHLLGIFRFPRTLGVRRGDGMPRISRVAWAYWFNSLFQRVELQTSDRQRSSDPAQSRLTRNCPGHAGMLMTLSRFVLFRIVSLHRGGNALLVQSKQWWSLRTETRRSALSRWRFRPIPRKVFHYFGQSFPFRFPCDGAW